MKTLTPTTSNLVEMSARADLAKIFTRAMAALAALPFCLVCKIYVAVRDYCKAPLRAMVADFAKVLIFTCSAGLFVFCILKSLTY